MNEKTRLMLFALLCSAMKDTPITEKEIALFSEDMLEELLTVSVNHDIAHITAYALETNKLLNEESEISRKFQEYMFKGIVRYERQNFTLSKLCRDLEKAEIDFIPLKGSVLKAFYIKPWFRTSCDIDILVKDVDLDRASEYLINKCGYTYKEKNAHDISLFSPDGQHLELHYGDKIIDEYSKLLDKLWQHAFLKDDYKHWYLISDEMFYFYHITHMAKHFEDGGCGIRTFLDLWILDHMENVDIQKRNALLEEGGFLKFADTVRRLCRVWLEGEKGDSLLNQMEQFVITGGVYGNLQNLIMVKQQRMGGKIGFALYKIFPPYDLIKFQYPILQKHKWLLPIMQVRRWGRIIFRGHAKDSIRELQYNQYISQKESDGMKSMLKNIGL